MVLWLMVMVFPEPEDPVLFSMQEIWVAAKTGGFHFKRQANQWIDTRDGTQLFAALSRVASAQAGCAMTLASV